MKPLVAVLYTYIIIMGLLSMLVTAPIMWNAAPNAYFGVLMVVAVWVTIIMIVVSTIVGTHEKNMMHNDHHFRKEPL